MQYTNPPGLPPSPEEKAATEDAAKILKAPQEPDAHYIAKNIPDYDMLQTFLNTQKSVFRNNFGFESRDLGPNYDIPMFVFRGRMTSIPR